MAYSVWGGISQWCLLQPTQFKMDTNCHRETSQIVGPPDQKTQFSQPIQGKYRKKH